jgi:hypothetical protein
MLVLSVRFRKPDMLEEPMPGKRYVSLSALSGIFCSVGDDVLPTPEAIECHPVSNDLPCGYSLALGVTSFLRSKLRKCWLSYLWTHWSCSS